MKNILPIKSVLLLCFIFLTFGIQAQQNKTIFYTPLEVSMVDISHLGSPQITAKSYKIYKIDTDVLISQLDGIAQREDHTNGFTALISFPHPDGSMHQYQAWGNSTLAPELSATFPEIKTYDAVDLEGRKVKWDITPKGLHAMIFQPDESTIFIDPVFDGNNQYYIVYHKEDFTTDKIMSCNFTSDNTGLNFQEEHHNGTLRTFGTCELRTYRLALAATGEYTAFHGGTVALAQAAQATTMNRVNGVYERDMAITMVIIPNNNLLIYTNSGSDPYSNGNPSSMINQNQTNVTSVIGSGNYDIGHVFGTNSGGLAGLGVVCSNSNKARGVTGSAAPIGDPFDIDYVAHEMGHQFGANHTQNNPCNSVSATRMEPGSASTIMGYAGICSPNVQSNSDDHFHGISLEEIGIEILSGGHTCEVITPLSNNPPSITGTNGNVTVPANTPFALTAFVTDPDGDPLLYCWEQMDNQASTQPPVATSTGGPNFRSNSPNSSPTRYFPNLTDLSNGVSPTWEVIPSVTRTMHFRVTVRDQSLNVPGCNDHEDITLSVDAGSGPFVVTYPSATGIMWTAASSETVTWNVANTNVAPVSCSSVDILLSTDGGITYPYMLASGVANDGSQSVTVPAVATTNARVMVINSNGTFFDISDNDFEITIPACIDPDLPTVSGTTAICDGQSTTLTVSGGNLNDATNWHWYTTSCGGTSVGTGTSISVSPSSTTSYFVRGEGGCVVAGACTTVEVTVNPVYNLNASASICQGQTYVYPDGTTGTAAGIHTSNLSTVTGCDSIIVTSLSVIPSYNINVSAAICDGDTYTFPDGSTATNTQVHTSNLLSSGGCDSIIVTILNVNNSSVQNVNASVCAGETYTFPDGSTSTVPNVNTSVLTDMNGCDSTIITALSIDSVDVSVSVISGTSPLLQANLTGANYQWLDCDNPGTPLPGETNQSFQPGQSLSGYAVIVEQGGCLDTSDCIAVPWVSVPEDDPFGVNIFPNPSSENVSITWNGNISIIELTDARGRIIASFDTQAIQKLELPVNEYAEGVYFVHLYTDQGRIVRNLVKK